MLVGLIIAARIPIPQSPPTPRQPEEHGRILQNKIAVHEAGHTVAAWCCTQVVEVQSVTIEASTGGFVLYTFNTNMTPESRWCSIVISLSGMASEIQAYGKMRSGPCGSDLEKSVAAARELIVSGDVTPPWKPPKKRDGTLQFEKMFSGLSTDEKQILDECYHMSHVIIDTYGEKLHKIVSMLLTMKTIKSSDLEKVLGPRMFIKVANATVGMGLAKASFILPTNRLSVM